MPFVVREDVGTTKRRSLSGHIRLKIWESTGGICVVCEHPIDGVRDRWIVEHIRALELGGPDEIENMGPAHDMCGRTKTREDHARTAQAKRQKIRHLGAFSPVSPLPGPRTSSLKRKVNGTVVRRDNSPDPRAGRSEFPQRRRDFTGEEIYLYAETCPRPAEQPPGNSEIIDEMRGTAAMSKVAKPGATSKAAKVKPAAREAAGSDDILPALPAHLHFILEDRPLLPEENTELYEALMHSIIGELKPKDIIETIWAKDIIDLIWEAKRLNRWRSLILVQADLKAAEDLIEPVLRRADPMGIVASECLPADVLVTGWVMGSADEKARVDQILEERGLSTDDVRAHGFLRSLPSIERIDRMIFAANQRRDTLFREIERKRVSFAQRGRAVATDIIDVVDSNGFNAPLD